MEKLDQERDVTFPDTLCQATEALADPISVSGTAILPLPLPDGKGCILIEVYATYRAATLY